MRGEPVGILLIVTPAARTVELAGPFSGTGIETKTEAASMHVRHKPVYPGGKTASIHLEVAVDIALTSGPT